MAFSGVRFKELLKKYGKVALGVHFTVSAASVSGLYVAINNNADVESIFSKLHISKDPPQPQIPSSPASRGGAQGLAVLCNKALFPIRVPITVALTPPIARFLARRKIIKSGL